MQGDSEDAAISSIRTPGNSDDREQVIASGRLSAGVQVTTTERLSTPPQGRIQITPNILDVLDSYAQPQQRRREVLLTWDARSTLNRGLNST